MANNIDPSAGPSSVTPFIFEPSPFHSICEPPTLQHSSHSMSIDNLVHTDSVAIASPLAPPSTGMPSAAAAVTMVRHTVRLGNGQVLTFGPSDVPDPPALRLVDEDLGTLIRWWDDASAEWDPSGYSFAINGCIVALKYWNQLYRRDRRWNANKNRWHLWKVSGSG